MSRLERWSRRKREHNETATTPLDKVDFATLSPEAALPHGTGSTAHEMPADSIAEQDVQMADEPSAAEARLADPDTLDPNSDFKAYLAPGVSPELKRRALRRMFSASQYNVRDGLDDYDQDFTQMGDLSREVASTLRNWMNQLSENIKTADDDTALASQARNKQSDTPMAKCSADGCIDAPPRSADEDGATLRRNTTMPDSSPPKNETA